MCCQTQKLLNSIGYLAPFSWQAGDSHHDKDHRMPVKII